jgi:Fic family protein
MKKFQAVEFEEHDWRSSIDASLLSKRQQRKIFPTYKSAIPQKIQTVDFSISNDLSVAIDDVLVLMARFDALQSTKSFNFPAVLLRSESSASSQIEHLTSSVRNIALAELSEKAPKNARLIAGNVAAMRKALEIDANKKITLSTILETHRALIKPSNEAFAGHLRNEQVWVGETSFSPHEALFVPPHQERIMLALEDLLKFLERTDVNPIVKTAVFHAQFETIHPFIDGNGRTGRALLHKILRDENILLTVTLPISAGLLNDIDAYMEAIKAYQAGDYLAIIEQFLDALELSIVIGGNVTNRLDEIVQSWEEKITEKRSSSIWKALHLLVEQPVVNTNFISEKLEITERASLNLVKRLEAYKIIRKVGNKHKGVFYQADEVLSVMEEVSDTDNIRRMFGN